MFHSLLCKTKKAEKKCKRVIIELKPQKCIIIRRNYFLLSLKCDFEVTCLKNFVVGRQRQRWKMRHCLLWFKVKNGWNVDYRTQILLNTWTGMRTIKITHNKCWQSNYKLINASFSLTGQKSLSYKAYTPSYNYTPYFSFSAYPSLTSLKCRYVAMGSFWIVVELLRGGSIIIGANCLVLS